MAELHVQEVVFASPEVADQAVLRDRERKRLEVLLGQTKEEQFLRVRAGEDRLFFR
jgi:hypothetical protein